MTDRIRKLTPLILWILTIVTALFALFFYFGKVVKGTGGTRYEEPVITNAFLIFAYILLCITLLVTLFFSIRGLILNAEGVKVALIALGGAVVLVIIASLLADNTVLDLPHYKGKDNVPRTLFLTDVGLYVAYFLAGLAFIAIIYSELRRLLRK